MRSGRFAALAALAMLGVGPVPEFSFEDPESRELTAADLARIERAKAKRARRGARHVAERAKAGGP